jgi:hypothetical protein
VLILLGRSVVSKPKELFNYYHCVIAWCSISEGGDRDIGDKFDITDFMSRSLTSVCMRCYVCWPVK